MHISAGVFKRQFDHFNDEVIRRSGEPFRSFQDGMPSNWEEYKDRVWHEAQERLAFNAWRQKDIGTGRILKAVIDAIEIKVSKNFRNNLVAWDARRGPKSRAHLPLIEASPSEAERIEQWAFDFYGDTSSEPEVAFDELVGLVGKRYALVGYLFFLKSRDKYLPIGTTTFDKAFSMLEVDLVTTRQCSWENYCSYIETISQVQRLLVEVAGVPGARLLDGHSFCWMMATLETVAGPGVAISEPKLLSNLKAAKEISRNEPTTFRVVPEEHFIQRELNQRRLGRLAQDAAMKSEMDRLGKAGHADPSSVVLSVWDEPARGYDILSAEMNGDPRHVEVKAARRKSDGTLSFILSLNEFEKSRSLDNYWFYLVIGADSESPDILAVPGQEVLEQYLKATTFEASFIANEDAT